MSRLFKGAVVGDWTLHRFMGWGESGKIGAWECECSCGERRLVTTTSLYQGTSTNCGCRRLQKVSTKRGMSSRYPVLYPVYKAMLARCYNPRNQGYRNYGGRGITVCDRWRESFENFLEDMGEPPSGMTLERVDNDGPYCRENCCWASRKAQGRNKRNSRWIEVDRQLFLLGELADRFKINLNTLKSRLDMYRMSLEDALSTPVTRGGAVAHTIQRMRKQEKKR